MASGSTRENYVICGIDVAIRALRAVMRDLKKCVIECGACPCRCGVACRAGRRVPGSLMIRIICAVVIRGMAAVTIRWHSRVIVVHMATCTGNGDVRTCQREDGLAVIKNCASPACRCMASVAGDREARLGVRRIIRRVVFRQVARFAGWVGQCVVVVDVTRRAEDRRVKSRKRETSGRMIPRGRSPIHSAVAKGAIHRVTRR